MLSPGQVPSHWTGQHLWGRLASPRLVREGRVLPPGGDYAGAGAPAKMCPNHPPILPVTLEGGTRAVEAHGWQSRCMSASH